MKNHTQGGRWSMSCSRRSVSCSRYSVSCGRGSTHRSKPDGSKRDQGKGLHVVGSALKVKINLDDECDTVEWKVALLAWFYNNSTWKKSERYRRDISAMEAAMYDPPGQGFSACNVETSESDPSMLSDDGTIYGVAKRPVWATAFSVASICSREGAAFHYPSSLRRFHGRT